MSAAGTCVPDKDTTHITGHPFRNQIFDYLATWRVREYGLGGGDTLSTFTDSTIAQPLGIAADDQGRVYVPPGWQPCSIRARPTRESARASS